jgi:GTP cyclohydrolase I
MDRQKMAEAVRAFLAAVDQRYDGDDQQRTPERVADAWVDDLLGGYALDPEAELTWTAPPEGCGPVLVRRIEFASICVHHLLPFFGRASVAYLPDRRMAGLSKVGRVIDAHARRMQTQERLTASVVGTLQRVLEPVGVVVMLDAEHTCMTLRGVRKERSRMTTVASAGLYDRDTEARREVLALLRDGGSRE